MLIERLDRGLLIRTPAKLNLFLDVLHKRADGYHEIDTIMCPVTLFDELYFEPTNSGRIEFSVCHPPSGRGDDVELIVDPLLANLSVATESTQQRGAIEDPAWLIPSDQRNLVVRALLAVQSQLGRSPGCRVRLVKKIPAAAGMGGGSSNAAAAIVAGLVSWEHWDRSRAVDISRQLGSDIALFLGDQRNGIGLARATGRGEHVEILAGRPTLCFAISHPPVGSSTAEVYERWRPSPEIRSISRMLVACEGGLSTQVSHECTHKIEQLLFNALQPPATELTEWIAKQLRYFAELGKPHAMMTGSGSACFALESDPAQAELLAQKMIQLGLPRAYVAQAWYATPIEQQLDRIT